MQLLWRDDWSFDLWNSFKASFTVLQLSLSAQLYFPRVCRGLYIWCTHSSRSLVLPFFPCWMVSCCLSHRCFRLSGFCIVVVGPFVLKYLFSWAPRHGIISGVRQWAHCTYARFAYAAMNTRACAKRETAVHSHRIEYASHLRTVRTLYMGTSFSTLYVSAQWVRCTWAPCEYTVHQHTMKTQYMWAQWVRCTFARQRVRCIFFAHRIRCISVRDNTAVRSIVY